MLLLPAPGVRAHALQPEAGLPAEFALGLGRVCIAHGGITRAAVDDLKVLIDNKKFKECLEKVEPQLQGRTSQGQLPRLLYYQGRALAGLDKDMDATVALMRVVIHFPDHKYAALARMYAGDLFQKRGDKKQAKALWAEAQGSAHNDPELKEGLQKRLN